MIRLGLLGYPLGHSLSPVMHKAAFKHLEMDGDYTLIETPPDELFDTLKSLKIKKFTGFNVTIPLKVWIVPLLDKVDDYSNLAGAVNTVLITEDNQLHGFNTDIYGFINAIPHEMRLNLKGKKAAVFGTGGVARSAAVGLYKIGVSEIDFYTRSLEKSTEFQELMTTKLPDAKLNFKENNFFPDLTGVSIAVNATPLGMEGVNVDISPAAKSSIDSLPKDAIVYDLVYKPKKTTLLKYAEALGLKTIDGTEMLVLQGAKAFEIWTNKKPPVSTMRSTVLNYL